ncbi:HD domain-containing protein [uncultured Prevotella sp.]|uniref:HD domain-containing protein n=1 Tax=uncultured Prevotella sp. TaxID=159272 RepID=UPI00260490EE|nr:HD domain-containing protein [uncultured Prevotella sp.]
MSCNINENKEEFVKLLKSTGREGVDDVIEELERLGFFSAPASAGHHLNVEGGLVQHSLNTCKAAFAIWEGMKALEPSLDTEVKKESIIISALLHDVCKADIYKRSVKKRKNKLGQWEDCEGYKVSYKDFPMGHGEKSLVVILLSGLELYDGEMLAIRWHMGAWGLNQNSFEDVRNYDTAQKEYPLVAIIHAADVMAANVMERTGEEMDEL